MKRYLPGLMALFWGWRCVAQGILDYGPDVTAEELLDSWLGEGTASSLPVEPGGTVDVLLRTGAGYKRNVLYSAVDPRNSGFSLVDAELYLNRDLGADREIDLYVFADQHHYFDMDRGTDDQSAVGELAWIVRPAWIDVLRVAATGSYVDQFFDASISDIDVDSYRLRETDLGGYALVEKRIGRSWAVRLAGGYQQVTIRDSIDDYAGRHIEIAADWARDDLTLVIAEIRRTLEDYEQRPKRDSTGAPLPGGAVEIADDRLTLRLRRTLDAGRLWQLRLSASAGSRDDDGGGYYDYLAGRGRARLRYAGDPMSVETGVGYTYLDYDTRPWSVDVADAENLYRSWWTAWLRIEYSFRPPWMGFAEVSYEDYDSNDPLNVYDHGWAAAGIGLRF